MPENVYRPITGAEMEARGLKVARKGKNTDFPRPDLKTSATTVAEAKKRQNDLSCVYVPTDEFSSEKKPTY